MINRRSFIKMGSGVLLGCSTSTAYASKNQVFANFGDHGNYRSPDHLKVANLIKSWNPVAVTGNGDNSYNYNYARDNAAYVNYIRSGRFLPVIGNHDRDSGARGGLEYFKYFKVPQYYYRDFDNVKFIMLDSTKGFVGQLAWARQELKLSSKNWNIVIMHYSARTSSSNHHAWSPARQPWNDWGADMVISGHDHIYERFEAPECTYVVNGLGGKSRYELGGATPYSVRKYNQQSGAMKINVSRNKLKCRFVDVYGNTVDEFVKSKAPNISAAINLLLDD